MAERLKAREKLVRTNTEFGPAYSIEPGGREIDTAAAERMIPRLEPLRDGLFDDTPPQSWRKKPRAPRANPR